MKRENKRGPKGPRAAKDASKTDAPKTEGGGKPRGKK
jgi:hypothetical protein